MHWFRRGDSSTDDCFLAAEVKESVSLTKQAMQGLRFCLRNLNDMGVREQYQVKISKRFVALENFVNNMNINRSGKILERMSGLYIAQSC